MKIVVTVVGKDRVGIIATVSSLLAENKVNILSINQNIMDGFFNMVMIAETTDNKVKLGELQPLLKEKGEALGVEIKAQHQDIFKECVYNVRKNIMVPVRIEKSVKTKIWWIGFAIWPEYMVNREAFSRHLKTTGFSYLLQGSSKHK